MRCLNLTFLHYVCVVAEYWFTKSNTTYHTWSLVVTKYPAYVVKLSNVMILSLICDLIPNCQHPPDILCMHSAVLIDAILRNGGTTAPETDHVPPPAGWRDEDITNDEQRNTGGDEKKSYTEDQRQGVQRCLLHVLYYLDSFQSRWFYMFLSKLGFTVN